MTERENIFLNNIYKILETNEDTSVNILARNMDISKSTLNRKLKFITGLSPNQLIREYRMKKATALLLEGYNVTQTAYKTGFNSGSYFIQCFKRFYKRTPKEYIKKNVFLQNRTDVSNLS